MDLVMPGINGFETTKAVRKDPVNNGAYIIAFTSYDSEDISEKCLEVGMNNFIQKPISMNQLKTSMENILLETNTA
jgi:CheY-like chemotaxis protein